jgi:hypothetical protein
MASNTKTAAATAKALSAKQEAADKKLDEWYAALAEKPALESEIVRLEAVISQANDAMEVTQNNLNEWETRASRIRQELDQLLDGIEQEGLA